jgi:hypothetical protein
LPDTSAVEADEADVLFGEAVLFENTVGGDLQIGTAELRHLMALQVFHCLELRIRGYREIEGIMAAGGGQIFRLQAARAADDRGQIAEASSEIELSGGERLVESRAGATKEGPGDLCVRHVLELSLDKLLHIGHGDVVAISEGPVVDAGSGIADADEGLGRRWSGGEKAGDQGCDMREFHERGSLLEEGQAALATASRTSFLRVTLRRPSTLTGTSPSRVVRRTTRARSP